SLLHEITRNYLEAFVLVNVLSWLTNPNSQCNKWGLVFAPQERDLLRNTCLEKSIALLRSLKVKNRAAGYKHLAPLGAKRQNDGCASKLNFRIPLLNSFSGTNTPKKQAFPRFCSARWSVGNRLTPMLVSVAVSDERQRDRSPKTSRLKASSVSRTLALQF